VPLKGTETQTKFLCIRRLQSTSLISVLIVSVLFRGTWNHEL